MSGDWKVFSTDRLSGSVTYMLDLGDSWVFKTETPVDDLLAMNAEELNDSSGKRFGDGRVVARLPEDLFYSKLAEPMRQRDQNYLKTFLNDADNRAFRTFRGHI